MSPSMNLPAHGTASPDPSEASVSVKDSTPQYTEQQRFRLAQPIRRQANLLQTAWRYSPPARRQRRVWGDKRAVADRLMWHGGPRTSHVWESAIPIALAVFNGPPGAIPVTPCYWFWHPKWAIMQSQKRFRRYYTHVLLELVIPNTITSIALVPNIEKFRHSLSLLPHGQPLL
ncbi:hypothetical protein DEO72_LG2g3357 [Vigna unguiculata]|uniref:Uncharacterized protein n=1 Tax=Vigna unguiculata TaxID=3917 RepID=A0A4D6L3H5_VIGUN|nr:hypothetical protein DEO72_LG2g3357 [Vigna unguiculata]